MAAQSDGCALSALKPNPRRRAEFEPRYHHNENQLSK